mgnify:FL=1
MDSVVCGTVYCNDSDKLGGSPVLIQRTQIWKDRLSSAISPIFSRQPRYKPLLMVQAGQHNYRHAESCGGARYSVPQTAY